MSAQLAADLARTIQELLAERPRVAVAVDGPDAAGKTTLADAVAAELAEVGAVAVRASVDGFHHPAEVRRRRGDLSPEGYYRDAFDVAALRRELVEPFMRGADAVVLSVFDYTRDEAVRPAPVRVAPRAALVVDGVFLLRPELRAVWALSVFLTVPPEETVRRAFVRDAGLFGSAAEVRRRYAARYLPAQEMYRAEADPESAADVVVDNTVPDDPVVARWPAARPRYGGPP